MAGRPLRHAPADRGPRGAARGDGLPGAGMKLDMTIAIEDLRDVPALAREAEDPRLRRPLDRGDPARPVPAARAGGGAHARVSLGTAIAVAFPRSPTVVAHTAWDLQAASGGRFILGLGTQVKGHMERRFSVKWTAPGAAAPGVRPGPAGGLGRVAERDRSSFRGEHYRSPHDAVLRARPDRAPADPDLHRGGERLQSPAGRRAVRRRAPPPVSSVEVPARVRSSRHRGRARQDRPAPRATRAGLLGLHDHGATPRTSARAREHARAQIAFYASTRTYEPVLAAHGWQDLTPRLHRKSVEGDWAGMAALITDEMLDVFAVEAPLDGLRAALDERYGGCSTASRRTSPSSGARAARSCAPLPRRFAPGADSVPTTRKEAVPWSS